MIASFPLAGYAYSSGLEAAVQAKAVRSGDDLSLYVEDVFRRGIAHREAVAVAVAHDALLRTSISSRRWRSIMNCMR